jgi:hypothetical protein
VSATPWVGEYESEPIPGLPDVPPDGERILWQGAPAWRSLARRAFHARKVAAYFAVLLAWRVASMLASGEALAAAAPSLGALAASGAAAVALLAGLAWLAARATIYTITDRRVVMRFGIALQMAVNLPYGTLRAAAFKEHRDGTGDIPLAASGAERIGWAMMWPHVRPWRFGRRFEPMLRCVPDANAVADVLAHALAASARQAPVRIHDDARIAAPGAVVAVTAS